MGDLATSSVDRLRMKVSGGELEMIFWNELAVKKGNIAPKKKGFRIPLTELYYNSIRCMQMNDWKSSNPLMPAVEQMRY